MIKYTLVFLVAVTTMVAADSDRASIVVQAGHTARVNAIAADTNRDLVATASNDYTVRLWKITPPGTGTLLRVFTGHTGFVEDVAFNVNDEHQMASCSRDMTLRFWNVLTGKGQRVDLSDRPSCLAYRPFSNIIAVGSSEAKEVSFYDANNGSPTDRPFTTAAPVTKVAYSKNGNQLVCGLADGHIEIRDARTKDLVRTVTVSTNRIVFVGFRGASVVAVSSDGTCVLIPETGDVVTRKINGFVLHASVTPSHDTLDVVTDGPSIVRVPLATMEISTLALNAKQIDVVVATKRGDLLAYGETDAQRYSWFLRQTGQFDFTSLRTYSDIQTAVAFSHDGSMLAVGDNNGSVTIWDLKRPRTPIRFADMGFLGVHSITFGMSDTTVVVGGFGGVWLTTINLNTLIVTNTLRGERDAAMVATINNTSAWVLDSRADELVSASTTGPNRTLIQRNVRFACMSEDESRIIALVAKEESDGSSVDSVVVIDAGTREVQTKRPAALKSISCISAPGNGSKILCGTNDGSILTVSTSTGKIVNERRSAHSGAVNSIAVAGEIAASAGNDALVRTWSGEITAKATETSYSLHSGQVRSVALSEEVGLMATASNDGVVCITRVTKDINETKARFTLVMMEGDWAVFSDDGHFDASESAMRLLKVVNKLEAFPIGSLRDSLYRPHLLSGNAGVVVPSTVLVKIKIPPSVMITAPTMSAVVDTSIASLSYQISSVAAGAAKVRVHNNDKLVSINSSEHSEGSSFTENAVVELVKGVNHLRVVVFSPNGLEAEDTITIVYAPRIPPKPRMFIVAVGINVYENPDYSLLYARSDAESVIGALQQSAPKEVTLEIAQIFDDNASVSKIEDALNTVEEQARPDDSFIFYYAGHGAVLRQGTESAYCFALHGVTNINDAASLRRESLSADSLRAHLLRIKALRQSVIIDACYSGLTMQSFSESDNAKYVSGMQRATGATVLASVSVDKKAKEVDELKHGLFTYAIVKGLEGAARDTDGDVTLFSLLNYISKIMPSLCKATGFAYQQPVLRYEGAAQNFVLSTK